MDKGVTLQTRTEQKPNPREDTDRLTVGTATCLTYLFVHSGVWGILVRLTASGVAMVNLAQVTYSEHNLHPSHWSFRVAANKGNNVVLRGKTN